MRPHSSELEALDSLQLNFAQSGPFPRLVQSDLLYGKWPEKSFPAALKGLVMQWARRIRLSSCAGGERRSGSTPTGCAHCIRGGGASADCG